tara:strand:- start:744 stop:2015 length:1272 start_codon:yes stop_codon:yes gene_type:complete
MNNKNKETDIINLGCRLNIYEGEVIKKLTKKNQINNFTIINSCAVTNEAEKKVRYAIRKAKRLNPKKKLVVTGCAAQIDPGKYEKMSEVDIVIGNNEKMDEKVWKDIKNIKKIKAGDIFKVKKTFNHSIEKFEGKSRAYIEIQQGCDHRCTFCIIPFGRGNNRSVPVGVIVERIKNLVNNSYKEVVLTGVDITDYGKDLPGKPNLFQLAKRILNLVPNLLQLRFSSIDCAEIKEDFWNLLIEKRFMPHLHLSLQSGNDLILKRMRRRHNRQQIIDFCKKVRSYRKDVVFGADIIAGFPTETEEMFHDTINIIKECYLTHLHVFPFSPRKGTPAALMPQIKKDIIRERAKVLRELGKNNLKEYQKKLIGSVTQVLIEQVHDNISSGKSQYFTKVKIPKVLKEGSVVNCVINDVKDDFSRANLIS